MRDFSFLSGVKIIGMERLGKLFHAEASRGETRFLMGTLNASEMGLDAELIVQILRPCEFQGSPRLQ